MRLVVPIATLSQTYSCARQFAAFALAVRRIYLHGEIGAGKTTFVGAVLHALGHEGAVRSPTFTFVEPYSLATRAVYHLDLYRLEAPGEVEFLGIADYLEEGVAFVEWPERAQGHIPQADIDLFLQTVDHARTAIFTGGSPEGIVALRAFERQMLDLRE